MSSVAVARLASLAREAAAAQVDAPAELARAIREAAASPADPWMVIGVLIAGAIHMIDTGIPPDRQPDCIAAACQLLGRRLPEGRPGRAGR